MKNNVCDNNSLRDCTGCGICASVCGKKAITIQLDNEGFYRPIVDEKKCVECGVCLKSCYKYDKNLVKSDNVLISYAAVNKDQNQLKSSSSGGISRVLMEESINRGYKVFGCAYDTKNNIAKSIIVSNIDELDNFYGSKYFQSYTVDGFYEILRDNSDQKYAIFGTPCQIYAFSQTNKYKRQKEKYLLVDIFCHGCPSMNLWKSYLNYTNKITKINMYDKIVFRSKTYGWHEFCFDFENKSNKYTSKKNGDPFYDLFFGMDIMNMACYDCNSRSSMSYTDIRLGDYWGKKYDNNTKGVSAVVIKSEKGFEFFEAIKNKLHTENTSFEHILSAQSYGKPHNFNEKRRLYLINELSDGGNLLQIKKKYLSMLPIHIRIKKLLKIIIKSLPNNIYLPIKKILHSI